jgi:hypothetical protein
MAKAVTVSSNLKEKDRVVATVDLRRVPRGTTGKVELVQGLSWIRYWVLFDNGQRIGTLHRSKLATLAEWENKASSAAGLVSGAVSGGVQVASGSETGPAAAAETIGGVPAHLIEKSRLARERWAAKKAG